MHHISNWYLTENLKLPKIDWDFFRVKSKIERKRVALSDIVKSTPHLMKLNESVFIVMTLMILLV